MTAEVQILNDGTKNYKTYGGRISHWHCSAAASKYEILDTPEKLLCGHIRMYLLNVDTSDLWKVLSRSFLGIRVGFGF